MADPCAPRAWPILLALAAAVLLFAPLPAARAADPALDAAVAHALTFAGQRLAQTDAALAAGSFPHYTAPNGTWVTSGANYWTSGYLPGAEWLMYETTRDARWLTMARARQAAIAGQASNRTTQDIGLMIGLGFGNDARLTGDANAKQVVRQAASTLATRYNATVGAIRSWDVASSQPGDFYLIVDGLMNLELLRDAVAYGGDPNLATIATRDALTTRTHHLRADGSTVHIVIFDAATGAVRRKTYGPGYSATSTWSRGRGVGDLRLRRELRGLARPAAARGRPARRRLVAEPRPGRRRPVLGLRRARRPERAARLVGGCDRGRGAAAAVRAAGGGRARRGLPRRRRADPALADIAGLPRGGDRERGAAAARNLLQGAGPDRSRA